MPSHVKTTNTISCRVVVKIHARKDDFIPIGAKGFLLETFLKNNGSYALVLWQNKYAERASGYRPPYKYPTIIRLDRITPKWTTTNKGELAKDFKSIKVYPRNIIHFLKWRDLRIATHNYNKIKKIDII